MGKKGKTDNKHKNCNPSLWVTDFRISGFDRKKKSPPKKWMKAAMHRDLDWRHFAANPTLHSEKTARPPPAPGPPGRPALYGGAVLVVVWVALLGISFSFARFTSPCFAWPMYIYRPGRRGPRAGGGGTTGATHVCRDSPGNVALGRQITATLRQIFYYYYK